MSEILEAWEHLQAVKRDASARIHQAELGFGRAIHVSRNRPVPLRVKQSDIEAEVGLKRERLRQIEREYEESVARAPSADASAS